MDPRITVLWNENSGSVNKQAALRKRLEELPQIQLEVVASPEELESAVAAACTSCDVLVAAGGDGTVNLCAQAILASDCEVALGILPLGTGNDCARALGIPLEGEEAVEVLLKGDSKQMDVAWAEFEDEQKLFLNLAAGGTVGTIGEEMSTLEKRFFGPLAYAMRAIATLVELEPYALSVRVDDAEEEEFEVVSVLIANGATVAGGHPVVAQASPFDGRIDVLLIKDPSFFEMFEMASSVLLGEAVDSEQAFYRSGTQIELRAHGKEMAFSFDGECVEKMPRKIRLEPRSLRVICAAEGASGEANK